MRRWIGVVWRWLVELFMHYIWLGIVVLLVAIVIDAHYPASPTRGAPLGIAINFLSAIGIAIIVAAIFTFASGTSEFVTKIRGLLEDVILKRDFLRNINPESKKEALKSLVQPSLFEENKSPNIGDYYRYFIDQTIAIQKKSVRSNYQVMSRAFYDAAKRKVAIEATYGYRLFPTADGFHSLLVGFEVRDGLGLDSMVRHVSITAPNGQRVLVSDPQLEEFDENGDRSRRSKIVIPEGFENQDKLDIEMRVVEYGLDHWQLLTFKALQPTDGFRFSLHCEGDLTIRNHAIFVVGAIYYVKISDDRKDISIDCNQWINEGSGLSILVSMPHNTASNRGTDGVGELSVVVPTT